MNEPVGSINHIHRRWLGRLAMARRKAGRWFRSRRRSDPADIRFALTVAGLGLWQWDLETDEVQYEGSRFTAPPPGSGKRSLDAYLERIDPDDRDRVRAGLAACAATGEPVEAEFRV